MNTRSTGVAGVLIVIGLLLPGSSTAQNQPERSLQQAFDRYVDAVQSGDLDALFSTVTDQDSMVFITAGGNHIDTRQGYYDFHERWFAEQDWDMPVELVELHEGRDYGYVLARFHFRGGLADSIVHHLDSYFTLIFHREAGEWKVVADLCSPIKRYQVTNETQLEYDEKQAFLFDMFKTRRTVRKFKPTPVPEEHIYKILNAARYAPTAGNQQPWTFLVTRDRDKLSRLKDEALYWFLDSYTRNRQLSEEDRKSTEQAIRGVLENVLSAPVYVAVLVDSTAPHPEYVLHDGVLAAGYLMIAARYLGYGTGFFTTFFPGDKMKTFFDIPDRYRLICFTPVGVPEQWPETPGKKPLNEMVVFESFAE